MMKAVLACILACVCVSVVLAYPQSHRQERSPGEDGGWVVKADKTKEGGTVVRTEAQKKWEVTKDGKVQAEVHGHWEKTMGGPQGGHKDHGYGGSIGGSWGK